MPINSLGGLYLIHWMADGGHDDDGKRKLASVDPVPSRYEGSMVENEVQTQVY